MDPACEYCRVQRAVVYCRSDSARLCLACDAHVHAANALARRHLRALICDRCLAQPAITWCVDDGALLCHDCGSWGGLTCSPMHRRQPVSCYSGCPSSAELLRLWSAVLNVKDQMMNINHVGAEHQFVCPSVNDPGLSGHSDDVYEIYHMNSNHNMYPFQAATLDGINMEKNFSVADSNTENALEASCSVNECVTLQALHDNVDQGGMDINGNWNQEACLPSGTDNKNISASLSNHTGESSAVDYQDCGVSPILINNESPLWDSNLDANYPQARNEAKMRYNEKKKSRSFGKNMKYVSRKVKAENTRARAKGRFVKTCEDYGCGDTLKDVST
ncbi:hypothetical protein J5N97_011315 [Dioscorea zingiberensis]|uniref:Uncharacterized protein n=1 Tax=Dioscorea zingiberensis TaxID=325984 RepID=A0A9D5D050_9LILI|nr:hypothetical protein J5N97_011315 [Dioscorea zingiberensis]